MLAITVDEESSSKKRFPMLSFLSAIGFAGSIVVLLVLEATLELDTTADQQSRVMYVMACLLSAGWSSIVSLITAWCPIILGRDRRPIAWVIPQVLAWLLFVQLYDWTSLVPDLP